MKKVIIILTAVVLVIGIAYTCYPAEYEGKLWSETEYRHSYQVTKSELLKAVEDYLSIEFDLPNGKRYIYLHKDWDGRFYVELEIRQPVEVIIKPKITNPPHIRVR